MRSVRPRAVLVTLLWLGALIAALGATPAPRPTADRDAVFANRYDRTINEIYASPSSAEDWGPDRLGDATIEPGQSRRVALGASRDCVFDIQVIYNDASKEERHGVDICRTHLLAFDGSRAMAPPSLDSGEHRVTIANRDTLPIQQVLISPAESGDWGDDRLADSISAGAAGIVTYRGPCVADLRVVFDNRSAEERRGLDLCALGGVTIQPGWTTNDVVAPPPPEQLVGAPLTVTVVNHAGRSVTNVYLSPDGSSDHGPDVLGSQLLEDGGQITVQISRPPGLCRFQARVVYGGKIPDQDLPGLDLCRDPTLIVPPRS